MRLRISPFWRAYFFLGGAFSGAGLAGALPAFGSAGALPALGSEPFFVAMGVTFIEQGVIARRSFNHPG